MKILLINPRYNEVEYRYKVNKLCPPLGMGYIGAVLLQEGHSVRILDMEALGMEWEELPPLLKREQPQLVGIHGTTPISHCIAQCAAVVRLHLPEAVIVVGGPHATLMPDAVLNEMPQVDYVLRGEAEFTMRDLVARIEQSAKLPDEPSIPGLGFRVGGELRISEEIPLVADVNQLPLPAYDLLPMDAYFYRSHLAETGSEGRIFTMMTSRGCPYRCIFCCEPVLYGHKFRARSAENVVDEMMVLKNKFEVNHIVFYDASFMTDRRRVERICRTILDRGLEVTWRARVRAQEVSQPLVKLMREAGCTTIAIGLETGTQRLLDIIEKRCTLQQIEDAFRWAHEAGLWTVAYCLLGIPSETREESIATVEFAKRLDPDWALFTHATPLPGTKLFEMTRDKLLTHDWSKFKFSANSPVVSYDGMDESAMQEMMDYAFSAFYLRKGWLLNRLRKATNPIQVERIVDSYYYYLEKYLGRRGMTPDSVAPRVAAGTGQLSG